MVDAINLTCGIYSNLMRSSPLFYFDSSFDFEIFRRIVHKGSTEFDVHRGGTEESHEG